MVSEGGEKDLWGGASGEEEYYRSRCGKRLLRRVWRGAARGDLACRGGVMLVHGLGDHSGRYDEVASVFVRAGFVVVAADFPGNGKSEGARGVMAGVEEGHVVLDEVAEWIGAEVPGGLRGLVAHSMGGFLGLLYLVRRPGLVSFCWVNGVLADPGRGQGMVKRALARILGKIVPNLTVGNGVRAAMCSHRKEVRDPLTHRRVSLGLGASLIASTEELLSGVEGLSPDLMLLATHGEADPVCPVEVSRRLIEKAGARRKRFVSFPGMLHETFRDDGAEQLFAELEKWLDDVVVSSEWGAVPEAYAIQHPGAGASAPSRSV